MQRSVCFCLLTIGAVIAVAGSAVAQQAASTGTYQGVSTPPADDVIGTTSEPQAKPSAAQPAALAASAPAEATTPAEATAPPAAAAPSGSVASETRAGLDGSDEGVVVVASQPPDPATQPALETRSDLADPDGDIVHPKPLAPGELDEGATIRVRLLNRLSSAESEKGTAFRSTVASDVLQGGQILIPAGAEIDGTVVSVSSGRLGGHGSMRLRPETVILADGSRFRLLAEVSGTPGARTRVDDEGTILPGSRLKRDGVEYGGAVGAGVTTGAIVAGPVGALTGGLIGAGAVTAHLLLSHPQATLESGTVLLFRLTDRLSLVALQASGN